MRNGKGRPGEYSSEPLRTEPGDLIFDDFVVEDPIIDPVEAARWFDDFMANAPRSTITLEGHWATAEHLAECNECRQIMKEDEGAL